MLTNARERQLYDLSLDPRTGRVVKDAGTAGPAPCDRLVARPVRHRHGPSIIRVSRSKLPPEQVRSQRHTCSADGRSWRPPGKLICQGRCAVASLAGTRVSSQQTYEVEPLRLRDGRARSSWERATAWLRCMLAGERALAVHQTPGFGRTVGLRGRLPLL